MNNFGFGLCQKAHNAASFRGTTRSARQRSLQIDQRHRFTTSFLPVPTQALILYRYCFLFLSNAWRPSGNRKVEGTREIGRRQRPPPFLSVAVQLGQDDRGGRSFWKICASHFWLPRRWSVSLPEHAILTVQAFFPLPFPVTTTVPRVPFDVDVWRVRWTDRVSPLDFSLF